jgi:hypothetical protein
MPCAPTSIAPMPVTASADLVDLAESPEAEDSRLPVMRSYWSSLTELAELHSLAEESLTMSPALTTGDATCAMEPRGWGLPTIIDVLLVP